MHPGYRLKQWTAAYRAPSATAVPFHPIRHQDAFQPGPRGNPNGQRARGRNRHRAGHKRTRSDHRRAYQTNQHDNSLHGPWGLLRSNPDRSQCDRQTGSDCRRARQTWPDSFQDAYWTNVSPWLPSDNSLASGSLVQTGSGRNTRHLRQTADCHALFADLRRFGMCRANGQYCLPTR